MRKYIAGFVLLFGFWLLLSFTWEPGHLVVGLIASVLLLIVIVPVVPWQARPGHSVFVWLVAASPTPVQKTSLQMG